MRLTVAKKIAIGLGAISVIGIAAMLIIYAGLNTVERAVHKLASEEAPFNAAAYEMEVNVNGIGFAVLDDSCLHEGTSLTTPSAHSAGSTTG